MKRVIICLVLFASACLSAQENKKAASNYETLESNGETVRLVISYNSDNTCDVTFYTEIPPKPEFSDLANSSVVSGYGYIGAKGPRKTDLMPDYGSERKMRRYHKTLDDCDPYNVLDLMKELVF